MLKSFITIAIFSASIATQAQSRESFSAAFKAFSKICTETAPSFRKTKRAAKKFGINKFTFRPQFLDTKKYGMYHGYSYEVHKDLVGISIPRSPSHIAVSYTTKYTQLDRMCVLTYTGLDGLTVDQMKATFLKNVEHQFKGKTSRRKNLDIVEMKVGKFDYKFSVNSYAGINYLYLHVWE